MNEPVRVPYHEQPKDLDHDWVKPPPGTFRQGKVCSKCGYRDIHKAARMRCGEYEEKDRPPPKALHDFDPYE